MKKSIDITNNQYHNMIALSYSHKDKVEYWNFKCLLCGNITKNRKPDVTRGKTKSCGCEKNKGKNNGNWFGYEELNGRTIGHYRKSAKRRNIEYDVTIEYLWDVFIKQEKKCPYTGIELFLSPKTKNNRTPTNASLDRIDSNKGYIIGNVQWVYKKINAMKLDLSQCEFIEMCIMVANHCGC